MSQPKKYKINNPKTRAWNHDDGIVHITMDQREVASFLASQLANLTSDVEKNKIANIIPHLEGITKSEWERLKQEVDRKFNEISSRTKLEEEHLKNIETYPKYFL